VGIGAVTPPNDDVQPIAAFDPPPAPIYIEPPLFFAAPTKPAGPHIIYVSQARISKPRREGPIVVYGVKP
jgi:hypothetical protein